MAEKFLLPDPGEGIHEAEILEIHVSPGDEVADGTQLFTVETDKAVIEIPSSFDGRIVEVPVDVGDIVEVGEVLVTYETGETDGDAEESAPRERGDGEEPDGERAGEQAPPSRPGEDEGEQSKPPGSGDSSRPMPASPATRSLAKNLGVDLHDIEGSGPDGRVEPGDVKAAAESGDGGKEEPPEAERSRQERDEAALPDFEEHGPVEWIDVRGVRRATARQMARSWRLIPHVTHDDVADITGLESFIETYADEVEEAGGKLTITSFLVKAAVAALTEHPRFNASFDGASDRLALKSYYNIGVAVDTDDGLVVPVIRDADKKSLLEIAVELTGLAGRMREGDRSLQDFQGGTFTITNPGGIGGTGFTPIINHPDVAILGAGRASQVPVVRDVQPVDDQDRTFELAPRLHLPLVLAFDHRVNDGADAARFMNTVVGLLEDFPSFLLRG